MSEAQIYQFEFSETPDFSSGVAQSFPTSPQATFTSSPGIRYARVLASRLIPIPTDPASLDRSLFSQVITIEVGNDGQFQQRIAVPQNLRVVSMDNGQLRLLADSVNGAVIYLIQISTQPDFSAETAEYYPAAPELIADLAPGRYYARILASRVNPIPTDPNSVDWSVFSESIPIDMT